MTFFDVFWYVFNFFSIALVVLFLCMNLTPRFNRYAVFFLTLIPFAAIALSSDIFMMCRRYFLKYRRLHIIFSRLWSISRISSERGFLSP